MVTDTILGFVFSQGAEILTDIAKKQLERKPTIEEMVKEAWKASHEDGWDLENDKDILKICKIMSWFPTDAGLSQNIRDEYYKRYRTIYDYYEQQKKEFADNKEKGIFGNRTLKSTYIDAYSTDQTYQDDPKHTLLDTVEKWCASSDDQIMLLHGEPGHGKTSFCRKAVYEFWQNGKFSNVPHVMWFSLNPVGSKGIIDENGNLDLEKAFQHKSKQMNPEDCQGGLIFLDGYDELESKLMHGFEWFTERVRELANNYGFHIVITARTQSVKNDLRNCDVNHCFAPLAEEQQDDWVSKNSNERYKSIFQQVREDFKAMDRRDEDSYNILGLPIVFRMVVTLEFEVDNAESGITRSKLYHDLFTATMKRRKIDDEDKRDRHHEDYENLSHDIYVHNNEDCNVESMIAEEKYQEDIIYQFYASGDKKSLHFLHRSFYQYFLAAYLYRQLQMVKDAGSAETFLSKLAEREVDQYTRQYLKEICEMKNDLLAEQCEQVLACVRQTDCIIAIPAALERPENGEGEENRYDRCQMIFRNVIQIVNHLVDGITLRELEVKNDTLQNRDRIADLFLCYGALGMSLHKLNIQRAVLSGADLRGANLTGANLTEAHLTEANLTGAHLNGANLIEADLYGVKLTFANLTEANLTGADLYGVNLTEADLTGADLRYARGITVAQLKSAGDITGCRIEKSRREALSSQLPDELIEKIRWD